jgi:hypothetical protein
VQAADGQELFAGAPVTKTPSRAALLKRGAMIASATAEKQLRDEGRTTSANAVKLTTQAAQGAGVWTILRDLYGFLPTFGQIVTWVIPLLMLSVVAILVLLGVLRAIPPQALSLPWRHPASDSSLALADSSSRSSRSGARGFKRPSTRR